MSMPCAPVITPSFSGPGRHSIYLVAFNRSNLALLLSSGTVFEILDYGSHPAVGRGCAIDDLGLICCFYTRLVEEFYRDDLQELGVFG